jgi:hypothetical protein
VKRLKLSSAVRPLADYIADFGDETVVLTEGNRAVAAIVPLKNVDRESLALSQHLGDGSNWLRLRPPIGALLLHPGPR